MKTKRKCLPGQLKFVAVLCILAIPINVSAKQGESEQLPVEHRSLGTDNTGLDSPWASSRSDLPQIGNLNVACKKNGMRVHMEFDRPFHGAIFSKGHFSDERCLHVPPASGRLRADFDIGLSSCGMAARRSDGVGAGGYIENTVIVQFDPLVQEVWDQARKLRCTWYDYYEKSVAFKGYNVENVQAVTANFLGDNLQCWMQIQVGKGPWASEVSGIVKIGQTMTMVLAIKDDDNKFDMLVRNCVAHDGKRPPIQLVDDQGCVVRPKIMSRFTKIRNFGQSASVVAYAYFQAFKFPDSMNVFFQCLIQVCKEKCPEPRCPNDPQPPAASIPMTPPQMASDKIQAYPFPNEAALPPPPPLPQMLQYPPNTGAALPVPVPIPLSASAGYQSVGRVGAIPADNETDGKVPSPAMAGPRSYDVVDRKRREAGVFVPSTDVRTSGQLQVVAPGDVAFNLNGPQSGSDNSSTTTTSYMQGPDNAVCMPLAGFVAGVTTLLLVMTIALLVAAFLVIRMRSSQKNPYAPEIQ